MLQAKKEELTEHCRGLKDLHGEIAEKFFTALTKIPVPILQKFPHFDVDAFGQLKTLHKHVQAKIRLTEKKISTAEKTEARSSTDRKIFNESRESEYPDDLDDYISLSERIDKNVEPPKVPFRSANSAPKNSYADEPAASTGSYTEKSSQDETFKSRPVLCESVQSSRELKNPAKSDAVKDLSDTESPQIKRGTFQLKRPVKATISTEMTKKIDEIWERNQATKQSSQPEVKSSPVVGNASVVSSPFRSDPLNDMDVTENVLSDTAYRLPEKSSKPLSLKTKNCEVWDDIVGSFSSHDLTPPSQKIEPTLSNELMEYPELTDVYYETPPRTKSPTKSSQEVCIKPNEQTFEIGNFTGNYKNDGVSGEFDGLDYEHSREMLKVPLNGPPNFSMQKTFLLVLNFEKLKSEERFFGLILMTRHALHNTRV